jgi:hypothetical protein
MKMLGRCPKVEVCSPKVYRVVERFSEDVDMMLDRHVPGFLETKTVKHRETKRHRAEVPD